MATFVLWREGIPAGIPMLFLSELFCGCFHKRTTFPMTVSKRSPVDGEFHRRTYVTCLNCGEELAYNWHKMRLEGRCPDVPVVPPTVITANAEGLRSRW